jgi:glycosidase
MRRLEGTLLFVLASCAAPEPGPVSDERCLLRAYFRPERALARPELGLSQAAAFSPELIGSWSDFARPGLKNLDARKTRSGERFFTATLPLPAGQYLYGFLAGDFLLPDDVEPQSAFAPDPRYVDSGPYEAEFSLATLPDCAAPTLSFVEAGAVAADALRFVAEFSAHAPGGELDGNSVAARLRRGGEELPAPRLEIQSLPDGSAGQRIVATVAALPPGKYTLTLTAKGRDGQAPPSISASAFIEATVAKSPQPPRSLEDAVVYHLIVDRFLGGGGPLPSPKSPGRRAGGSLAGVRRAVEAGYFSRLGVTTLWLSPLYENPEGQFKGRDGHDYEAYHGYWPKEPRSVEPTLGGAAELEALVAAAHARGLRVIFDAVPNHVYKDHPYFREHSRLAPPVATAGSPERESWFHDGPKACVCGTPGCGWGERIEDCWFDSYLPDLNWRHPDVMRRGVEDLLWWLSSFDLDGMRIDAVPMMPRAAARRIVRSVQGAVFTSGLDSLILGENYTGPGDLGRQSIRSFLGRSFDGLDSAFDFPLMWAMRSAVAAEHTGMDDLEREIAHSDASWAGAGAVMAHILDNHDTPRFLSEAAGNAGNDPWADPPDAPVESTPYRKQLLGLTLLLTLPGLPVIYYGDEVAIPGAGDPDSRRPLPDVLTGAGLSAAQSEILATTGRLGRLRACLSALRRGARRPLLFSRDFTVAVHEYAGGSPVIVAISKSRTDLQVRVPGAPSGRFRNALDKGQPPVDLSGDPASLPLHALRPAVYVADGDPCLQD